MDRIKWLFSNMEKPYKRGHILALCISVITSFMLLINPALSARLIDEVIIAQNKEPLLKILFAMLSFKVLREVLRYLMIVCFEKSSQNTMYNIRKNLFDKLQYQDERFFSRNRTGDLMTRMTADVDWCRHFLSYINYAVIDCVCMFLFTTIYFFMVSTKLTFALLFVTPFLLLITKVYSRKVRPLFVNMREKLSMMNAGAQENIAGNRVVKAFAREDFEIEKFDEKNAEFKQSHLDINKFWLKFFPAIELLANSMTLITVFLGGYFIITGEITPGELTIFTGLSWALSNPMRSLGNLLNDYQRFSTSCAKVMEVALLKPHIRDREGVVEHDTMQGDVEFDNVSYQIDSQPILKHISFKINKGQTLAIMGPTGSGKTTIINLLSHFANAKEGVIKVDGMDVKKWRLQDLRKHIGVATQEVFLFSDTVENNIAFANANLTLDEVKKYAKMADADDFITHLSEGYDTVIGERGVGLSGGQRQRIALARALASQPTILVMDDTTSAVDMETEKYIQEQLKALPFECTKIIIAQRISSVKDADLILIVENGEVTQSGTHQELLQQQGYYRDTFLLQNDIQTEKEAI